jgi:hypothetical protein
MLPFHARIAGGPYCWYCERAVQSCGEVKQTEPTVRHRRGPADTTSQYAEGMQVEELVLSRARTVPTPTLGRRCDR